MKTKRKLLSLLIAGAMLFSILPANALAEEIPTLGGLCEHHQAHTPECGFIEGEDASCTFVCEICNPADSGKEDTNTLKDTNPEVTASEDTNPEIIASKDTTPEVIAPEDTALCAHHQAHTADCGFLPATADEAGSPCTYVCRICLIEEQIAALPDEVTADNAEDVQTRLDEILTLCQALNADEQEQIDLSRCEKLQEALDSANAPAPAAAKEENFGDSLHWALDDNGTLTITGTGDMPNFDNSTNPAPWSGDYNSFSKVEISNGVTSIGDYAFSMHTDLREIELPNSITSIGDYAFRMCESLSLKELPDSVTSIGNYAFRSCMVLSLEKLPDNLTSIGDSAFSSCYRLKTITIPAGVKSIGEGAFQRCTTLTTVTFEGTIAPTLGDDQVFSNAVQILIPSGASGYTGENWSGYNVIVPTVEEVANVEKDGTTTPVTSLDDAFVSANDGATITLLTNVERTTPLEISGGTYILELNGKSITKTSNEEGSTKTSAPQAAINILDGELTIQGKGTIIATNDVGIWVQSDASLTVESGTIGTQGDDDAHFGILVEGTATIHENAKIVSNGTADRNAALFANNGGIANINEGTFLGGVAASNSTVNLYGGTFSAPTDDAFCVYNAGGIIRLGDTVAFYKDGVPIIPQNELTGTVSVAVCKHNGEDIWKYQFIDGTNHHKTCLACGYNQNESHQWNADNVCENCGMPKNTVVQSGDLDFTNDATPAGDLDTDGYHWDKGNNTLTLKNSFLTGTVTLPDDTVKIVTEGNSIIHELKSSVNPQRTQLTFSGAGKLTIQERLNLSGGAGNTLTVEEDASVAAENGIAGGSSGGGTDFPVTVHGTLTVKGTNDDYALYCGKVTIGATGILNVSGEQGVMIGSMNGGYIGAFTIEQSKDGNQGGIFNANCGEFNLAVIGNSLKDNQPDDVINLPGGYLPKGYVLTKTTTETPNIITIATEENKDDVKWDSNGKIEGAVKDSFALHLTHEWGDEWQNDKTDHWHLCTYTGCKAESPHERHVYNNQNICTTCNYKQTTVTPPDPTITRTITYDANGGTGTMKNATVADNTLFTLPECGFTPPQGMVFDVWAVDSVNGTRVKAGDRYAITANTTFYAIWKAQTTRTITYDANGGTGTMKNATAADNTLFTLPKCGFTPPQGMVFDVWAVDSVSGTPVKAGDRYTITADTVFYAIWKAQTTPPVTPDRPSSGGGSSGESTYRITVEPAEHGTVTSSHSNAAKGTTIKLTIAPDSGYMLDTMTVTDSHGDKIKLTAQDGGKYTFTMPSSAVTVKTTFSESPDEDLSSQPPVFTDITDHWAADDIIFVASRGLLTGTGGSQFSPDASITRGMFVTTLGRLAGIDPEKYKIGRFTDVKADAYYAPYVNWAAEKGIANGTSATTFSPDANITREQTAVILANYTEKMNYDLPLAHDAVTFADSAQISSWAAKDVKAMQQAGIMAGKDNNRFDPKGTATRAEAATVLRRFIEIIIDPQTTQAGHKTAAVLSSL